MDIRYTVNVDGARYLVTADDIAQGISIDETVSAAALSGWSALVDMQKGVGIRPVGLAGRWYDCNVQIDEVR